MTEGEVRSHGRFGALLRTPFLGRPNLVPSPKSPTYHPGRALDVGWGEGADALWLVRRGWQVTAVDISLVTPQRAAARGANFGHR